LVNYVLKAQHGWRIAVIENEYGSVSIDDALVTEKLSKAEEIIALDNGCVCCTVRGDLISALASLARVEKKFDAVIIELTGLADPAPVALTFNQEDIRDSFRIDSILCLVDCKHILPHLNEVRADFTVNEAVHQVAFADRLLLNKLDLVTEEEKATVRQEIRSINSFAQILECRHSKVDLEKVLALNSFSVERCIEIDPDFLLEEEDSGTCTDPHCHEDHGHGHGHGHAHAHGHGKRPYEGDAARTEEAPKKRQKKRHDLSGVGSVGVQVEGTVDLAMFGDWLRKLVDSRGGDLYRTKGILHCKGEEDMKLVFQGVHEQLDFGEADVPWQPGEKRICKFVFIGRQLDEAQLTKQVRSCIIDTSEYKEALAEKEQAEKEENDDDNHE